MRTLVAGPLMLLLAACGAGASTPMQLSGPAPGGTTPTMDCVTRQLTRLGYTISSSDAGTGTVQATHLNPAPWYQRILGFNDTADQITAIVGQGELKVVATSSDPNSTSPPGA